MSIENEALRLMVSELREMINLIDWADYLTVAVFAKAATYLTEAEGDKYTLGEPVKETLDFSWGMNCRN